MFKLMDKKLITILCTSLFTFKACSLQSVLSRVVQHSNILKQKRYSDFHGTVYFDPIKMSQQKYTKMFIKRPTYKS